MGEGSEGRGELAQSGRQGQLCSNLPELVAKEALSRPLPAGDKDPSRYRSKHSLAECAQRASMSGSPVRECTGWNFIHQG